MDEMNIDMSIDAPNLPSEPTDEPKEATELDGISESATVEQSPEKPEARINYDEIAKEDLVALREEFGELASLSSITELNNPLRYAALRDLGLSPREAYLATAERTHRRDNRSHLYGTPRRALGGSMMPEADMAAAREIFGDLSDTEIRKLYKKVTV